MSGFLHGVAGVTLYMVGLVCAFVAVVALINAEIGDMVIFGALAYGCWLGIQKITSNPWA